MQHRSFRWLEPTTIAGHIRYMVSCCLRPESAGASTVGQDRQNNRVKNTLFASVGAAVALAVLIGVLVTFAEPLPGKQANISAVCLICLLVVVGAGATTYFVCGSNNRCREQRDEAIRGFCQRAAGFHFNGRKQFDQHYVGTIPWFVSEEWMHTFGLMAAELPVSAICMVECHQIIDPVLVATDSKLMQGASHFVSNRHQRLYRREMEAVVFAKQLEHVPDLVMVPKRDAQRAYYKRALQAQHGDVADFYSLPRKFRKKYYLASAAPDACAEVLSDELLAMLETRDWCIIQVMGGHCVVLTAQWHGNHPAKAPHTVEEVAANIDFALRIFDVFNRHDATKSTTEQDVDANVFCDTDLAAAAVATVAQPTTRVTKSLADGAVPAPSPLSAAVHRKKVGRRQRHSVVKLLALFSLGLPLTLLSGLCALGGSVELQRGAAAHTWPQVEGTITHAAAETTVRHRQGQPRERYRPQLRYKYDVDGQIFTNDEIMYGASRRIESKREIEALLAKYPLHGQVVVYHHPRRPEVSVLQPGVENQQMVITLRNICLGAGLFGILLCGYGAVGRQRVT